jgi:DNA-binding NarL/FixJ family response regulator
MTLLAAIRTDELATSIAPKATPRRVDARWRSQEDDELRLLRGALDALDSAVLIVSSTFEQVIYRNGLAARLVPGALPSELSDALDAFIERRADPRRPTSSTCVRLDGRMFFIQARQVAGHDDLELVTLREQVVRDADVMRLLENRYGVSRREYLVIGGLRLGKTNREIAKELGLAEGTVARHIHRVLERFSVPNRTRLVDVVERLVAGSA